MKNIVLFLVIVLATQTGCPTPKPVRPALNAVVDCLGENRESVDKLKNEFLGPVLGGGSISWTDAKQRAIQAGKDVGGCFIMELTQWFLSGTRATPDQAQAAREAAESFRKEQAGGSTFRTMCVREDGTQNECKL
jgi:hypothetical protein